MIKIHIEGKELWNEKTEQFETINGCDLVLEHSLVSIGKWESRYHKPFISTKKTYEETLDYVRMMDIKHEDYEDIPLESILLLTKEQIDKINDYINDPMTATTIPEDPEDKNPHKFDDKFVTNEEIYYWMTAQQIPSEYQYWHLNRLITLIKVCAFNNKPKDKKKKKWTSTELAKRRAEMQRSRAAFKAKAKPIK